MSTTLLRITVLAVSLSSLAACGGGGDSGSGGGSTPSARIGVSISSLGFGTQPVGSQSSTQTLTVTNLGTATLSITGITVSGSGASSFSQANTCNGPVAPSATCSVNVTFVPTAVGPLTAALGFTSNATNPPTVGLNGSGSGTAGTGTLRTFVNELADGTYKAVTVGDARLLNQQILASRKKHDEHILASIGDYLLPRAEASTNSCLQFIGLKNFDSMWESVPLLNSGSAAVCALDAFNIGSTHILVALNNAPIDGEYCNMLVLRKSDGQAYCVAEDAPNSYRLSRNREGYTPVVVSGNGRFVAVNYSINPVTVDETARLMLLDVAPPDSATPKATLVWGVGPSGGTYTSVSLNYRFTPNFMPTNDGHIFFHYDVHGQTGSVTRRFSYLALNPPFQAAGKNELPLPGEVLGTNCCFYRPLAPGKNGAILHANVGGDHELKWVTYDDSLDSFVTESYGYPIYGDSNGEKGLGLYAGAHWDFTQCEYSSSTEMFDCGGGQNISINGAALDPTEVYFALLKNEYGTVQLGPTSPMAAPRPASCSDATSEVEGIEASAFDPLNDSFLCTTTSVMAVVPSGVSVLSGWSGSARIRNVTMSGPKVAVLYSSQLLNASPQGLVFDLNTLTNVPMSLPENFIVDQVEASAVSPGAVNIRGFDNESKQPFEAQITAAGELIKLTLYPAGSFPDVVNVITLAPGG